MGAIVNTGVLFMWLTVLIAGFTTPSAFYLSEVGQPSLYSFWCLLVSMFAFTPSNAVLVAVLSCYMGGELARNGGKPDQAVAWRRAISRGVGVFVVTFFLQSWFAGSGSVLSYTQEEYFKIAGATAVLGLAVGQQPQRLMELMAGNKQEE